MKPAAAVALLASLLLPSGPVTAAELSDYLPEGTHYDPAIPTPRSVLGFEVGEWHVRHDQLVRTMEAIAEASDRASLTVTGQTYEGRPLLLLTLSSPDNLTRLPEILERHRQLSEPSAPVPDLSEMPVIVYLGYSIHGNEASGSNASMAVAYHLAAGRSDEIDELLRRTVVLLDPSFNPDGLGRFAHWANMHRGRVLVPDPAHREHREAWPGGRTNHYWFDLNRDWLPAQHPESQARLEQFHRFKPNVLADFHEMGTDATYFFQPGVPSRQNPLTPERNFELTARLAHHHAAALDGARRLYYTRETFDDFYYGKGSTYPDANGAIGILFEQASARGHRQESSDGEVSFPFAIQNQVLTSLSTLRGAAEERVELLRYQADFYRSAIEEAATDPVAGYLFGEPEDPVRAHDFLELLLRHRIEVHRLVSPAHGFEPESGFIVPSRQPQYRLVRTLFERPTTFTDSTFYDVSTWTLPLAFDIPHRPLEGRELRAELLGPRVEEAEWPEGRAPEGDDVYAYAFGWSGTYAPRAAYRLFDAEVRLRVTTLPFEAETDAGRQRFDRGSLVVPVGLQEIAQDELAALLTRIAREDGVDVYTLQSGLTVDGADLGSPNVRPLDKPVVAIAVGRGVSGYEAGELWHLLDQRMHIPVTLLDLELGDRSDLERYTHVILVDGSTGRFGEDDAERWRRWTRGGGTLIATKRAAVWATEHLLPAPDPPEDPAAAEEDEPPERLPYAEYEPRRAAQLVSGAIFEVSLDLTHPLAYGYPRATLPVFRNSTMTLPPETNPYTSVAQYTDAPRLSGYVSEENLEKLPGSPAVAANRLGEGLVVRILDNPSFRAFWYGPQRLVLNALFFGQVVRRTER